MKLRKEHVWRKKGTAYDDGNTHGYTRSQSVMVWGSFGAGGVGEICIIPCTMTGESYRNILDKHLKKSARKIGLRRGWLLCQDNDPKHKSRIVQTYLDRAKIKCVEHPPQSPDMNPIENLWDYVERRIPLSDRTSIKKLESAIFREWNKIPSEICLKFAMSMTNRIKELKRVNGRATKY